MNVSTRGQMQSDQALWKNVRPSHAMTTRLCRVEQSRFHSQSWHHLHQRHLINIATSEGSTSLRSQTDIPWEFVPRTHPNGIRVCIALPILYFTVRTAIFETCAAHFFLPSKLIITFGCIEAIARPFSQILSLSTSLSTRVICVSARPRHLESTIDRYRHLTIDSVLK